jgi:hypothetical protein
VIGVGLLLMLLMACGTSQTPADDDSVLLPDRVETVDSSSVSPDGGPSDATTTTRDVMADVATDAAEGGAGLHAFVTSSMHAGNLGGFNGADTICTTLAHSAMLGGTWAAWLSYNGAGQPSALQHVTSNGPWRLRSGDLVALTKTELTSGMLRHAIDHDENGLAVAGARVWTGTGPNGLYLTNDCDQWTTGAQGRVGLGSAANGMWTSAAVDACGQPRHLYCFQLN